MKRLVMASGVALAAAAASPSALAQACAGFNDVSATDTTLCPAVEWMKNRAITIGCSATLYCPNDVVLRSQMALFMKRLGDRLTPEFVRRFDRPPAQDFSAARQVCVTPPVPPAVAPAAYPRRAIVRGLLNVFTPNGGMNIEARVVFSTDNGVSWQVPPNGDGFAYGSLYSGLSPPDDITLVGMTTIDLNTTSTYVFAVQGVKTPTGGSGTIANVYCETLAQIVNRISATSPLDEPPPVQGGRGN
ncbi:MAG TPA: hypothetical protein VNE58_17250 [Casimicrobiaceae bacterium]|nr:hypothetical protein [Casimicrobiaceae bacterium]